MSDSLEKQRRRINSAEDLHSVVRMMKAMAASNIGQYERAVRSLDDYYRTVQLGLSVCFRQGSRAANTVLPLNRDVSYQPGREGEATTVAVVFGSDQGLVGAFNEVMAEFVTNTLATVPGKKHLWVVGERIQSTLDDNGLPPTTHFVLPATIGAITPLVGQILLAIEAQYEQGALAQVYLFYNRPQARSIYRPVSQRLLPLDAIWQAELESIVWPTGNIPEVINNGQGTLLAFVHEYIFVSLFRACAESLASEHASRLEAMLRAEKNIDELLSGLNQTFHHLRQSAIDEELFDLVAGFEALT